MIHFADISIKIKLNIIIVLTSTIVSVIALSVYGYLEVQTFKEDLKQQGEINAHLIGNYCITPLTFRYTEDAKKILEEAKTVPSIDNVFLFTEDNKVLAQYYRNTKFLMKEPEVQKKSSIIKNDYLHVFHPIIFRDVKYGTVYLRISTSEIDTKIRNMIIILILLAVGITGFSFIIAHWLQGIISGPLLSLSNLTQKVSEKNDYTIRAENTGNDEIGLLQKGFNTMLEKLETRKNERDKAEAALRKSEEKYRQIVETAQEGIWIINKEGYTAFINSRMADMFGHKQNEMTGKHFSTFLDKDVQKEAEDYLKTEKAETNELCFKKKNGENFWALISTSPLYNNNRNYNGTLAMIVDITDRKDNEKELEKYRNNLENLVKQRTKKLKEAQQELIQSEKMAALGKLTASVSHELRNPLGTIRSSFYTIEARTKDKNLGIEKALDRIDRNISRCDNIIEDLLDYSRTREMQLGLIDIDSWINELLTEQNFPKNVTIRTELKSNIKIELDIEKIRRCLINIIENACQAIIGNTIDDAETKGNIKIITKASKKYLFIEIWDDGPGIPQADIEKIFEPLFSTKSFGFGLGLSIVKQIIEQHKGSVTVKSVAGEGTTFILKIPLHQK